MNDFVWDGCFRMGMELFEELQEGRIHLFCNKCNVHKSNMVRIYGIDPDDAALLIENCPSCSCNPDYKMERFYFNENGLLIEEEHYI